MFLFKHFIHKRGLGLMKTTPGSIKEDILINIITLTPVYNTIRQSKMNVISE